MKMYDYETQNHALKIENYRQVDVKIMDAIALQLKDIADDIGLSERVQEISCRRYDGFIPHSWNQGGYQSHGYTTIDMIMGSGCMSGSEKFNDMIEDDYNKQMKECFETYCKENDLDPEKVEYDTLTDDQRSEYESMESEWLDSDYDSICVQYQGRYLGYENGVHTISLNIFLCSSDAPYHRSSDDDLEIEITFKDIGSKNCQNKIKKAVDTMTDFIGSLELY